MELHGVGYVLVNWFVSGLAVFVTAKIMPGITVKGFGSALMAALVIGIGNAIVWPILIFLTLPINIITLGLFTFVINGAILKMASAMLSGFDIKSWWSAIFGSIVLSILGILLHYLFFSNGQTPAPLI